MKCEASHRGLTFTGTTPDRHSTLRYTHSTTDSTLRRLGVLGCQGQKEAGSGKRVEGVVLSAKAGGDQKGLLFGSWGLQILPICLALRGCRRAVISTWLHALSQHESRAWAKKADRVQHVPRSQGHRYTQILRHRRAAVPVVARSNVWCGKEWRC